MKEPVRLGASRWSAFLLLLGGFSALWALACSGGAGAGGNAQEGAPGAVPTTLRDSAGITIVENAEPQWALGSEWQVGRLLTSIGEAQGDPPGNFGAPTLFGR